MPVNPDLFRAGMRRLAAGVSIITTLDADRVRYGMTATAMCSVTVAPPTLLTCVNQSASMYKTIVESKVFAVNVLSAADRSLSDRFAGAEIGETRFHLGDWSVLESGSPILNSAIAAFDCVLTTHIETGTHGIFIGEVTAAQVNDAGMEPLLYLQGAYGGFRAMEALIGG
jgi:flavin reductase (DIM6/NTAB) family NADH-FMN oxidoreductase RutF